MERDIAKTVIIEKEKMNEIAGCNDNYWITHYSCPNCKNTLQQKRERIADNGKVEYTNRISKFNFCLNCGQRLKWGDK